MSSRANRTTFNPHIEEVVDSHFGGMASQELSLLSPSIFSIGQTSTSPRSSWKIKAYDKGKELYSRSGDPRDAINGENREKEDLVLRLVTIETDPKVSP
ncbi:hypothetical protein PanWU01x14_263390 [Parasponia andersonii]|uniref:Uncharacterized protein n=1 Tax=Parasponia andersonii TaxID=3476 RepID=A0A2P5B7T0_PARAD|nr:hypothetical protein PanWU01x14_263390 [Parasponia andersonii]